ncbi:putative C6 transcription factor [Aspergillus tanneri]|uniref:Xylanolytic transcriptional activator regulatory domain-containing protein n=1 Tax=Aspergillus tanneri TaxID=1220188 RepID=A0A5M9MYY1_9EURO|nr:uncharacterized protein ATNIH1004_003241 [Aspergillus tanneri]KAA8650554.1 hypothetical protein ATNIH1004_003241 [Aspergillus tanneri]
MNPKCTGRPSPCKACQNTEAECIFDETLDLRRKVAAKRTLGELEYYRSLLKSLLESIRSSTEEKLHHILHTIRNSPSLNDVASVIDAPAIDRSDVRSESLKGISSAEDAIVQQERLSADAHSRIALEKLCDMPLFQVPAKPWTRITVDNHLVSHLVSLYFTWDHPLSQIIDQNMFLEHMNKCDTSSEFCTPLLVNSLLAMASAYSDFPEVFATPDDVTSKGKHFYSEAERLWKAEDGQVSLTNIQAVTVMSCVLKFQAKDHASWLMLRQAVQLSQDFGMFQVPRTGHQEWKKTHINVQYAGITTAWGIFALNSQMSLELSKVANLERPRFRLFMREKFDVDVEWAPYPSSNKTEYAKKPALLRSVMVQMTELIEIIVEIQDLLFDKSLDLGIDDMWTAANKLYIRLGSWLERLPDFLQVDEEQIPQVLFLHIKYHHTIIVLSRFFLRHEKYGRSSHSSEIGQVRSTQLQSANQITRCLRVQHASYGLRHIPRQMLEPTNDSALAMLVALEHEEFQESFIDSLRFLIAFSKRLPQARDMVRNIEETARELKILLPLEASAVLDHRELESSQWL